MCADQHVYVSHSEPSLWLWEDWGTDERQMDELSVRT